MKKIKYLLIFILILQHNLALTQEKSNEFEVAASIMPLSLIDIFDGISIRPSVDFKVYKNYSLGIEYGKYLNINGEFKRGQNGYLIKPIIKYYLNKERVYDSYIALEFQHKDVTFKLDDQIAIEEEEAFFKEYSLNRKSNLISLKFGETVSLGKKFIFEAYVGLGVRFLNSTAINITQEELDNITTTEDNEDTLIEDYYIEVGDFVRPNLTFGIKYGFKIK